MLEYLKDPIIIQYIISGINVIAAIIVIIAAFMIRKNRKHIEKTTKLMGKASGHLQDTFDSMVKSMISLTELRKLNPQDGDIQIQAGEEKKPSKKKKLPKPIKKESNDTPLVDAVLAGKDPFIDLNKTIELTDEVDLNKTIILTDEVIPLTDEVKRGKK